MPADNGTAKLHFYRGEQDRGDVVCGKAVNRVVWTDVERKWNAPENEGRRCGACVRTRLLDMMPT